ncbi:MAG: hypothetical protein Rubg2KO_38080 [Rubricoccaceae bacterium]
MSRFSFVLLLALAPCIELAAQGVVPDTTSPARYAPLGIGDVWHYRENYIATYREARRVLRDSTVNDTTYAVLEVRAYPGALGGMEPNEFNVRYELLRFDSTQASVMVRTQRGEFNSSYAPCRLDAPFPGPGSDSEPCVDSDFGGEASVYGSPEETLTIGGTPLTTAVKTYVNLGGGATFAAGVGLVSRAGDGSLNERVLEYAVIDGQSIGNPLPDLPALVAAPASPTTAALSLAAFPSPTAGPITLALDLPDPQPVALAAFDALGRRVWHDELARGADRQRVEIDASAWAPGLYLVRAVAGDASSTVTVVRR